MRIYANYTRFLFSWTKKLSVVSEGGVEVGVSALGNVRVDLNSYGKRFEEIGKGFLSHCQKIHL